MKRQGEKEKGMSESYRVVLESKWSDVYPEQDYGMDYSMRFDSANEAMRWAEGQLGKGGWTIDPGDDDEMERFVIQWKRCVVDGARMVAPGWAPVRLDRHGVWHEETVSYKRSEEGRLVRLG